MTYRVDISGLDDLIEAIEEAKKLDDVKEVVKMILLIWQIKLQKKHQSEVDT